MSACQFCGKGHTVANGPCPDQPVYIAVNQPLPNHYHESVRLMECNNPDCEHWVTPSPPEQKDAQ